MNVSVIGTGYVGLVSGTCLAEMGNDVICVDNDARKIESLRKGEVSIYEPGLEELIQSNVREGRLHFTTNLEEAVRKSPICMIAVGTPQGEDGSADLGSLFEVAQSIAKAMDDYRVIVIKSTVPVGTSDRVRERMARLTAHPFSMVSNPEFLKQGAAVDDFLKPDRVVIGANDQVAADLMREIYSPFLRTGNPLIFMDIRSAEMTKYAANAFLATKISFINEISNLCERIGADIDQVRTGIASDSRIGNQFLFPGLGYGGSCFPKDVQALIKTIQQYDYSSGILEAVHEINRAQRMSFLGKIMDCFENNVTGKTFAVWGMAFKPRTDDMREAPSIDIIEALCRQGANIQAYDPKAMATARQLFKDRIAYCHSAYDALKGADGLLLLTEWNEFRRPDFERMRALMNRPLIFDGRNQYDPERMAKRNFEYYSMGRPFLLPGALGEADKSVEKEVTLV